MSTLIKSFSQFVNENVNNQRVFEAEGKKPSEMEIRKSVFDMVAYPTTKESYSKLLSTMTGKDIVGSGSSFSLIRDFIVGLSNEAVEYVQAITGQSENMEKGLLVINVRPKNVDGKKEEVQQFNGQITINTRNQDISNVKSIFEIPVDVIGNQYKDSNVKLTDALLLSVIISADGKTYIKSSSGNPIRYKDFVEDSTKLNKGDKKDQSLVSVFFDKKGEVVGRVNKSVENKHSLASEVLASVPTEQKMQVINSYSPIVKSTLQEGIANFKSKESKEVPDNVAPKPNVKDGEVKTPVKESRNFSTRNWKNFPKLNEAKSCKGKVVKFLKDNDCVVDYEAGTCKEGTKTMKIEKALLKFKAPESLIKSYTTECTKEVNEALRLRRMR